MRHCGANASLNPMEKNSNSALLLFWDAVSPSETRNNCWFSVSCSYSLNRRVYNSAVFRYYCTFFSLKTCRHIQTDEQIYSRHSFCIHTDSLQMSSQIYSYYYHCFFTFHPFLISWGIFSQDDFWKTWKSFSLSSFLSIDCNILSLFRHLNIV